MTNVSSMSKVEKVMVKINYKWLSLEDAGNVQGLLSLQKDSLDKTTALPYSQVLLMSRLKSLNFLPFPFLQSTSLLSTWPRNVEVTWKVHVDDSSAQKVFFDTFSTHLPLLHGQNFLNLFHFLIIPPLIQLALYLPSSNYIPDLSTLLY